MDDEKTKDRILGLLELHPDLSQADAARALDISRQRVSQLANEHGITFGTGLPKERAKYPPRRRDNYIVGSLNHFGLKDERRNPLFIGTIGELLVAVDLMKRDFAVYRAMAQVAAFDLVAAYKGKMWRIECRCARYNKLKDKVNNRPVFRDPDRTRSDVLALILPDGSIIYRVDPESDWPLNTQPPPAQSSV